MKNRRKKLTAEHLSSKLRTIAQFKIAMPNLVSIQKKENTNKIDI